MKPIAYIRTPFPTKFGIPRQSNIVNGLEATIVFEPEYRQPEAFRGLDDFDYIWILWQFSGNLRDTWSPTVRPPRLGGNRRMGVFATRSPFRPNPIGLSSVRLLGVDLHTVDGPVLRVSGADLMDGTPVYDIKPYIPYTDAHPEARSGFAPNPAGRLLNVECPSELSALLSESLRQTLFEVLAHDPRPSYQHDSERVYVFEFDCYEIKFNVNGNVLTIVDILPVKK